MFRKKPSIPCLLFISCLCSGLGSSVDCCCKIYHPELGSSELTNVGHDWKTCDTCVLTDTAYLPQDSGISAGKLRAGTALSPGVSRGLLCSLTWPASGVGCWLGPGRSDRRESLHVASVYLLGLPHSAAMAFSEGACQGSGAFFYDLTVEVTWGHSCLSHKPPISRFRA